MRYLVTLDVLINLYYTLTYPFLIYGFVVWGNTYPTNIKPLFILQKRTISTGNQMFCSAIRN